MVRLVKKSASKEEVLALLDPLLRQWFEGKFSDLTEPQGFAVPLIHRGKNVIVSSPTGSGKTLTAFLSIINELYQLQKAGRLEDRIYCVYISPLKALANDIDRNLKEPLKEMTSLAEGLGEDPPRIRVAVRSGDTPASERQRMARKPPHIFITTPESLALVLSTPKFSQRFRDVQWVIVDEIHEICSSKRGTHLSLCLERLRRMVGEEFVRIGLSATIAPMREVAKFLAGYQDGRLRPMNVVEVEGQKGLDLSIMCPVQDMTALPYEVVNARMYDTLKDLVEEHRTTLVFTNTRSGTEAVTYKLQERGIEDIAAHHGSLSRETRLDVEERLKNGDLKVVVSSTSLELGIDIGYIDLVVQVGSPKSIAKGLQRIGRAGHAYGDTSVGRFVVFDNDDLMECAALVKGAYDAHIDRVDIPRNCLDVLAQNLVGMSLERRWDVEEAFGLVRNAYSFHTLKKRDFQGVLDYLSSRNPKIRVYAKLWQDGGRIGRRRDSRIIYFTNIGTIPEEGDYRVISDKGARLGRLSEKFVEYLSPGDVFVLGGRTYQFERARGMKVFVHDATGQRPTVPSWTGEMLPRSFDLSMEVARFRRLWAEAVDARGEEGAKEWLMEEYRVDRGSAETLVNYVMEQRELLTPLPTDRDLLLEGYVDAKGTQNIIFHFPFGRRVNDALSRAYAHVLGKKLHCNVRVSITDDSFMLTVPRRVVIEEVPGLLRSADLEDVLKRAVRGTELFKQRFRHCATRSFMVLRSYKGRDVSMGRQQLRSERVLNYFHDLEDFPVIQETYNEILNQVMDLAHAKEVLERIEAGEMTVHTAPFSSVPSPFAHGVVLSGMSDIVLMEDRSALLRQLHREVLKRVVPESELTPFQFEEEAVREHFRRKVPAVSTKDDLEPLATVLGALNLRQRTGANPYDYATAPTKEVRAWCEELVAAGRLVSVWTPAGVRHTTPRFLPVFASVYAKRRPPRGLSRKILASLRSEPRTTKELAKELGVGVASLREPLRKLERAYLIRRTGLTAPRWHSQEAPRIGFSEALDTLVKTYLGSRGPMTLAELAHATGQEEPLLESHMKEMEGEGAVVSGAFLVGEAVQYMLPRDLASLRGEEDLPTFSDEVIRAYRWRKQMRPLDSVDEYFDLFVSSGFLYDIVQHVKDFDFDAWARARESGRILQGRFVRGRVRYVRPEDARLLASLYERDPLTEFDRLLLEEIRARDGATLSDLVKATGEEKEVVKESLNRLDWNLHVIRKHRPGEGWSGPNLYIPYDPPELVEDPIPPLVRRYLRGYGPASLESLRSFLGIWHEPLEEALGDLEAGEEVVRIRVEGPSNQELYMLSDELADLRAAEPLTGRDTRVVSLYEPYLHVHWSELVSRYGDGWYFPVLDAGEIVGMTEAWEMSGVVELREVVLEEGFLPHFLEALDDSMDYFRGSRIEIIRIVRAGGERVEEMEDLSPYLTRGYHAINGFLAKGAFVPTTFPEEDLLTYILWRQGVLPERRFPNVLEAIAALGGLRSDYEAALRATVSPDLAQVYRQGLLVKGKGIPGHVIYTTPEEIALCRVAKAVPMDDHMKMVYRVVREDGPISRKSLINRSPLGYSNTISAVRRLADASCLVQRSGRGIVYGAVDAADLSVPDARREVIRRLFSRCGTFAVESLAEYMRGAFNRRQLRSILKDLEEEGTLVKGFFQKGDPTVRWMLSDGLDVVGQLDPHLTFVLSPQDHLSHYLRSRISRRWGSGYRFVVFRGSQMIASFRARKRPDGLEVLDYQGDPAGREAMREFAREHMVRLREEGERVDDYEVMRWYEKMYGRSAEG
jgi:ATP-dependent Lhr-like helicase